MYMTCTFYLHVVLSQGFCNMAIALRKLGLLSEETHQRLQPGAANLRWVGVVNHLPPPTSPSSLSTSLLPPSLSLPLIFLLPLYPSLSLPV